MNGGTAITSFPSVVHTIPNGVELNELEKKKEEKKKEEERCVDG